MSDQPAAAPLAPSINDLRYQCQRPSTSLLRNLPSPTSAQYSQQSTTSAQRCLLQPTTSAQRCLPSPTIVQCNKSSTLHLYGGTHLATNRAQSAPRVCGVRKSDKSALADVLVMFQPPYAVQDVAETELKCAMLTIIDRMCGNNFFHRQCNAVHHYSAAQPTATIVPPAVEPVTIAPPPVKLVTKSIWDPEPSNSQRTYPWMFTSPYRSGMFSKECSALDKQLDSQIRNLWSAPPAVGQPASDTCNVDPDGKARRGDSLPALPSSFIREMLFDQYLLRRVAQQSTLSSIYNASTAQSADLVAQTNTQAPTHLDASAQPTINPSSPLDAEAAIANQELATQTQSELSTAAQLSFPLDGSTSSVTSEVISTFFSAPQSSVSVDVPESAQQTVPMSSKQKQLKALQEQHEMQQRQLQLMREKRTQKKNKRQKEKKRKQQQQPLQQDELSQDDHEDQIELQESREEWGQHENDKQ